MTSTGISNNHTDKTQLKENNMEITDNLKYRLRGPRALYGEEAVNKFAHSHVCIAGTGGVGSWAIESLVRTGVGHITIIDKDTIDESNTNRQLHTMQSTLGEYKAEAMKSRMKDINPDVQIDVITKLLTIDNIPDIISNVNADIYIDAIDDLSAKAAYIHHIHRIMKKTVIVAGGAGGKTNPLLVTKGDLSETKGDKLLARLRAKFRKEYGYPQAGKKMKLTAVYSTEQGKLAKDVNDADDVPVFGAAMCVTAVVGLNIAALVLEKLRG